MFFMFIATHQAVRSKIGEDVAEQLQRQLLLDHQKNEVGKLKQDELLRQRGLAKGKSASVYSGLGPVESCPVKFVVSAHVHTPNTCPACIAPCT